MSPVQFSFSFKNRQPKPQHDQGVDSNSPDWRVFVLQNMEATQLYKAVVCCAMFCVNKVPRQNKYFRYSQVI